MTSSETRPAGQAFRFTRPVPYPAAALAMDQLVDARWRQAIPDTVLFLEHAPVITLGNRGRDNYLLRTPEALAREGVTVAHATRGGDVTFHGPGQLVVYPIVALQPGEADAHRYLEKLEEAAIRVCGDFGVPAFRVAGKTGAWTDRGKIAAIGVRFKRWIASHGMSFNVTVDLRYTDWIVPCGLVGLPVTSLQAHHPGGGCPGMAEVQERMRIRLEKTLNRRLPWADPPLPEPLQALAPFAA